MWDGQTDLTVNNNELDHPCNTAMYLSIRQGRLNMTITNRSNDMIWGAYGANAVHFSFMQEYLAAAIGVKVGTYYQMSNNLHTYLDFGPWAKVSKIDEVRCPYSTEEFVYSRPMVNNASRFLPEIEGFCDGETQGFKNKFITEVAVPIQEIYDLYKSNDLEKAIAHTHEHLHSADWKWAIVEWLARRIIARAKRKSK